MKIFYKITSLLLIFSIFVILCGCEEQASTINSGSKTISSEYALIRIHIRANSNSQADQSVKLKVRDAITLYLEGELYNVTDFDTAYEQIKARLKTLDSKANEVLASEGFAYQARSRLNEEFFPTRSYEGIIVESGYYDALIVELGGAKGDNWWCVIYPPLCYLESKPADKVKYKSYIAEIYKKYFSK